MNRKLTAFAAALPLVMMSGTAFASTTDGIGGIANSVSTNIQQIVPLIVAAAFLGGVFFAVSAILKMKDAKENPRDNSVGTIALNWGAAVFLVALGGILGVMTDTFALDTGDTVSGSQTVTYGP